VESGREETDLDIDSLLSGWQPLQMIYLLAAAVGFSAPVPVYLDTWISPAIDFPRKGVTPDRLHTVGAEITVNPSGYVESCRAYFVIGNPSMGPYTCRLIQLRALFQPARDANGHRTFGIYRQRMSWWMGKAKPPLEGNPDWDFVIPVSSVSPDLKLPELHRIKFEVDSAGSVSRCAADDAVEALGALACAQLSQKFKVEPARTRSGKAVSSIQNIVVRYVRAENAR